MSSRFDGLDNELLNLKDVIIKRVNVLESNILTPESDHNLLEQYR